MRINFTGCVHQRVTLSLYEEFLYDDGVLLSSADRNYIKPATQTILGSRIHSWGIFGLFRGIVDYNEKIK